MLDKSGHNIYLEMSKALEMAASVSLGNMNLESNTISQSLQELSDACANMSKAIFKDMDKLKLLQESFQSLSSDTISTWKQTFSNLSAIVKISLKDINYKELNYISDVEKYEYNVTQNDIDEIEEDIVELISEQNENSIDACKKKWSEKHPELFQILLVVLGAVLGQLLSYFCANTKQNCNIYIDSNNKSSVIVNIPKNTPVTIVDDTIKYYYKILYTDTENDNDNVGYISKKNIIINK